MKITPARCSKGVLILSGKHYLFRVYASNYDYRDYRLLHSDLSVEITDPDAYFYETANGDLLLDHSPETLGLEK